MKRKLFSLFLLLALLLTACQPEQAADTPPESETPSPVGTPSGEPAAEPTPPADEPSAADTFRAVLLGQAEFFSTDAGEALPIDRLNETVSSDPSVTARATKFAILDLDGDGADEVLLQLDVNSGVETMTEILRLQDGAVYGYTLWGRAFHSLKTDGTFSFSSGAMDFGFGTIAFTDTAYTVNRVTYSETGENWSTDVAYTVDHESADSDRFYSAIIEQDQKEDAFWYYMTEANVNAVFSPEGKTWSGEPGSVDQQIQLIADHMDDWVTLSEYAIYGGSGYTVTDLDGNGRLELIGAYIAGTGHFTTAYFYEVDETYTQLVPCSYPIDPREPLPDILSGPASARYSADTGTTYYVFEDFSKIGATDYPGVMVALWLKDGEVHTLTLAMKYTAYEDDGTPDYTSITDWTGAEITEAEYLTIGERYFAAHQTLSASIAWLDMTPDEIQSTDYDTLKFLLFNSYQGFAAKEAP